MNTLEKYAVAKLKSLANEIKLTDVESPTITLELQQAILRKDIYTHLLHHSTKQSDEE